MMQFFIAASFLCWSIWFFVGTLRILTGKYERRIDEVYALAKHCFCAHAAGLLLALVTLAVQQLEALT